MLRLNLALDWTAAARQMSSGSAEQTVKFPLGATEGAVSFGPFHFDPRNRLLYRAGDEVVMPPRVLGLLEYLLERPGQVIGKDTLIREVWRDTNVSETSLTEAVSLLRQTLGDDPQRPIYVQTVHRRGYRFIAPASTGLPAPSVVLPRRTRVGRSALLVASVALLGVAGITAALFRTGPGSLPARSATRFTIALPGAATLRTYEVALALSPDGRELVYVQGSDDQQSVLMRRPLGALDAKTIPGTEDATAPFFSFDGTSVAFFADGKLKRVRLDGSLPAIVCDAPPSLGGAWAPDGTIVFASKQGFGGLWKIGPNDRKPVALTVPDAAAGEVTHTWPEFLPDGRSLLFTVWSNTFASARIALLSLEAGTRRVIVDGGSYPRYLPAGYLLYGQAGSLVAAPFDAVRGEITGRATTVVTGLDTYLFTGLAQFAVSRTGTLAYVPARGKPGSREVEIIARDASVTRVGLPSRFYRNVKVAPDGLRLALTILDGARSVWVTDADRRTLTRLTFEGFNIEPVWSPDGKRVAYASNIAGPYNMFVKPADGSGPAERLITSERHQYPMSWSPDGRHLIFAAVNPKTGFDLHVLTFDGPQHTVKPLKVTDAEELYGLLSPDGRWLMYTSNESGRSDVYLEPFPATGARWQVSVEESFGAGWSPAGDEILLEDKDGHSAARVRFGSDPPVERPRTILSRRGVARAQPLAGGRVVALVDRAQDSQPREIHVVVDWETEVRGQTLNAP